VAKYSATGGQDFVPVPAGAHVAVCTMVADIGIQPSQFYEPKRKVVFRFELPNERTEYTDKDGNKRNGPMVVYDTLTASMNGKANLRAMLEGWRGRKFTDDEASEFDTRNVLGKSCMLSIVHNEKGEKTYANIAAVMPLPKGTNSPEAEGKVMYYDEDDAKSYDDLPEWVRKKIDAQHAPTPRETVEDHLEQEASSRGAFHDDPIPFAPLCKRGWV
jgi:hypothetical protein